MTDRIPSDPPAPGRDRQGEILLEAKGISKQFGDILANDDVSLTMRAGEIHALLGENGAGKSTLVKILYGALEPNSGSLHWQGREVSIETPAEARRLGIGMVFQHFSLFEALTVAENIALAMPRAISMRDLSARIRDVSRDYGLTLDPGAVVADLPVGIRQRIEIVRCLLQEPRLIIMDEPTVFSRAQGSGPARIGQPEGVDRPVPPGGRPAAQGAPVSDLAGLCARGRERKFSAGGG